MRAAPPDQKLAIIMENIISGKTSLNCRKRLAAGEAVTVKFGELVFRIEVQGLRALMKYGEDIVLQRRFVPWEQADEDYAAMIESFGDRGEVDEGWFERASSAFHARFE